jgi:tungstate transport system ATP-binding protein
MTGGRMNGGKGIEWLLRLGGVTLARDGTCLLSGIDLDIVPGERLLLLGPNGAGKTLLMHVAHRLIEPNRGRVEASGDLREAMVFQRPVLLRRSVIGNVLYALRHARLGCGVRRSTGDLDAARDRPDTAEDREASAMAALRLVGLESLAHRPARVLSGGEQQRVALARAAALRPDLVWLDEPTANLDPASTQAIESIVMRMSAEGTTCIMSTHDIGQARRLAQRVVLMSGGRIIESTEATRFFAQPMTDAGRRYLRGELLNA